MKIIFSIIALSFVTYLLFPANDFPSPPPDSVQSSEPGDSESFLRRAYFTNFTRQEVINHYQSEFGKYSLNLNYPPEEAQTLIRDQTRSTFLEELTYPLRESLFINGFEPKDPKDDIWYKGEHFRQKIIVRLVSSNLYIRGLVSVLVIFSVILIYKGYKKLLK